MEVRTYTAKLDRTNMGRALKTLDDKVRKDLGTKIKIRIVTDTEYRGHENFDDYIARVVVYERSRK